jgi:predicted nucleic acid-binding protein
MKKVYIIDASIIIGSLILRRREVLLKFRNILKDTQKEKVELFSINLLNYEVANGLKYSIRNKELIIKSYQKFLNLPIKLYELSKDQFLQILKISLDLDTTIYDTSYHYLAIILKGMFLTADKEYFKKGQRLGFVEFV